jgi:hypothetical protein
MCVVCIATITTVIRHGGVQPLASRPECEGVPGTKNSPTLEKNIIFGNNFLDKIPITEAKSRIVA